MCSFIFLASSFFLGKVSEARRTGSMERKSMMLRIDERTPPDNDTSNNPVKVLKPNVKINGIIAPNKKTSLLTLKSKVPKHRNVNCEQKTLMLHHALEHSESLEVYTAKTPNSQVLPDVICWFF
jgi:hypothetical protein